MELSNIRHHPHFEGKWWEEGEANQRALKDLIDALLVHTRIAKLLNAEGAPAPKPKRVRDASGELQASRLPSWSPSTVKVILDRRRYLGEGTWNRTEKRDAWGQKKLRRRPEAEWIRASVASIITEAEWRAAHDRLDGVLTRLQATGAALGNRRARDIASAYLLSGFARCGMCGGSLAVLGGSRSSARRHVYGCIAYHKKGSCSNGLKIPMDRVDTAVLNAIADEVLGAAVVRAVVDRVMVRLAPTIVHRNVGELRTSLQGAEREIRNLTRAIAMGGDLEFLLHELRACEKRRDDLRTAIDARERVQVQQIDRVAIEAAVRRRVDEWRSLLTRRTAHGRQLLREMLAGPIKFTPNGRAYRFEGEASFGALLSGEAGLLPTNVVPLRGFEPRSRG